MAAFCSVRFLLFSKALLREIYGRIKKSNRGGKREGAGRPFVKERKKFVTISVTGTPERYRK